MSSKYAKQLEKFMSGFERRNPSQPEFYQAVKEVVSTLLPYIDQFPEYKEKYILERMTEPDRVISFRVTWEDDQGRIRVNRAWRVQFNNSIGAYKGGLRFHPNVNESIFKFLGFEQTFKNALTGLPMGGAKGGSNFNPKGKSEREIARFCRALMAELHRYIGENIDVPAGDIGVGGKEISWLFGAYKRLNNRFAGILTGKGLSFGGSMIRKESTGFGTVYFMKNMLNNIGEGLEKKRILISGSGNVALYCIQKCIDMGAIPITASDSSGFIHDKDGINSEKIAFLIDLKEKKRKRIIEYAKKYNAEFIFKVYSTV